MIEYKITVSIDGAPLFMEGERDGVFYVETITLSNEVDEDDRLLIAKILQSKKHDLIEQLIKVDFEKL